MWVWAHPPQPTSPGWEAAAGPGGGEAEAGLRELGQGLSQPPSSGRSPRGIQIHDLQILETVRLRLKGGLPTGLEGLVLQGHGLCFSLRRDRFLLMGW